MRFALLALIACGGAPQVPTAHKAATAPETLGAALAREVGGGQSVAIVGLEKGIVAISADGARQRALTHAPAGWVIVDPRANVVWFGNKERTAFFAIDLEQAATTSPAIATVVKDLPSPNSVEMVGPTHFAVAYVGATHEDMPPDMERYGMGEAMAFANASVTLELSDKPEISAQSGYTRSEDWEASAKEAKIASPAFVAKLLARPSHAPPPPPWQETHVDTVDPSQCQDANLCGKARPLAKTRYWRVLVAQAQGDVGHFAYQLYDADARRFVDGNWATHLGDIWVAPDGVAFVTDGAVVRFDRGPLVATPLDHGAYGGGWLGGGAHYAM